MATTRLRHPHIRCTRATTATANATITTSTWTTRTATPTAPRHLGSIRRHLLALLCRRSPASTTFKSLNPPSFAPSFRAISTPCLPLQYNLHIRRPESKQVYQSLRRTAALMLQTCACRRHMTTYRQVRVCRRRTTCHRAPSPRVRL